MHFGLKGLLVVALLTLSMFASADDTPCATAKDTSIATGARVLHQSITLNRVRQRVVRRDCANNVASDQLEDVNQPIQTINIQPEEKFPNVEAETTVYNRTTCQGPGYMNGLVNLLVDLALMPRSATRPASIHFFVSATDYAGMYVLKDQENYIDYTIKKCVNADRGDDDKCKNLQPVENGVLILSVRYQEIAKPEVKEIKMTERQCRGQEGI